MKIAIFHELIYPYNKGGGEIQRFQIAKYLAEFGHSVTLVGYKYPGSPRTEHKSGFKIKRVGLFNVRDAHQHLPRLFAAAGMLFAAIKEKYDIMMTNPYFSLPVTIPLAKLLGKPVAITWDDVFGYETFSKHKGAALGVFGSILEKLCLFLTRYADVVFTVSSSTKNKLMKSGIDPGKIVVMYSGINPDDYPDMHVKKKRQIIYAGRHVFYKNVDHLIQAFAQIARKDRKINLVILGYGTLTEYYKQLSKELGVEKNVKFMGFVDHKEKLRLLRESLFLVLPSSFEGFGLAVIEANACNIPYIAYDIPAVREVTEISNGGLLVKEGDVDALKKTMEKLIRIPKERASLAKNGRENVCKKLTWKSVAEIVNKNLLSLSRSSK